VRGAPVVVRVLAAALVPGLGHATLGLRKRGLAFFLLVAVTFATGLLLEGGMPRPDAGEPFAILATATTAATGVLGLAARFLVPSPVDLRSATAEYGRAYLLTAGLMNLLLILDTLDRSAGRRA
jgi:hypothetical protein